MLRVRPMPRLPDGRAPVVTSSFGPRRGGMHATHYGVDMLYARLDEPLKEPWTSPNGRWSVPDAEIGQKVPAVAAASGTVRDAGWINTGYRVRIDHGFGWYTSYMHLSDLQVRKGDDVLEGDALGTIGYSPYKAGCTPTPDRPCKVGLNHLHFQLERGTPGNAGAVDPERYFERNLVALELVDIPTSDWPFRLGVAALIGYAAYEFLT